MTGFEPATHSRSHELCRPPWASIDKSAGELTLLRTRILQGESRHADHPSWPPRTRARPGIRPCWHCRWPGRTCTADLSRAPDESGPGCERSTAELRAKAAVTERKSARPSGGLTRHRLLCGVPSRSQSCTSTDHRTLKPACCKAYDERLRSALGRIKLSGVPLPVPAQSRNADCYPGSLVTRNAAGRPTRFVPGPWGRG